MQVKLKVIGGTKDGSEIPIAGPKFLIGRAPDCHLRPGSEMISRHHCVMLIEQSYLAVRDFGSKNGTLVNDEPIRGEQELKAGDVLGIGPLRFEICLEHGLGGKKRSKVKDMKEAITRTAEMSRDEVDINSWLEEDDAAPTTTRTNAGATRSVAPNADVSLDDTAEIKLSHSDTLPTPATSGEPRIDDAHADPVRADNSQSAAMDVLRKMRDQQKSRKK